MSFLELLREAGAPTMVIIGLGIMWILARIERAIAVMGATLENITKDVQNLAREKMETAQCNERHAAIQRTLDNHEERIHENEKPKK